MKITAVLHFYKRNQRDEILTMEILKACLTKKLRQEFRRKAII